MNQLNNNSLTRFWFETKEGYGIGVTAFSITDAEFLIKQAKLNYEHEGSKVIENVDIRNLDQDHVIPNMRPPNFRGIWYPMI